MLGALGFGLMAYLVLRYPRWLAWRSRGGTWQPTREQLAQIDAADVVPVRIAGGVLVIFAIGFAIAGLLS